MMDDERAVREWVATWLAASHAGDLSRVLSLMSDDVIFMVPGKAPFGKEAFAAGSEALRKFRMEAKSDIQEIKVLDGWAYLRNHLTVTMTPRDGGTPTRRAGHTLTILRKQPAGNWVLVRDANLMAEEVQQTPDESNSPR
jgi:uncharacterized protein (TIGR02246 family)